MLIGLSIVIIFRIVQMEISPKLYMIFPDSDGFCGFQKMSEETYSSFAS
ncbi:MAG: hypothetical protein C5S47_06685 [Candidatus Methanogasteraceae archaeon]|nr:MAG: hypothetical protein C5S47_06685 [ANME-2 cluster archaeon]